jgi:hypothetical protein
MNQIDLKIFLLSNVFFTAELKRIKFILSFFALVFNSLIIQNNASEKFHLIKGQ